MRTLVAGVCLLSLGCLQQVGLGAVQPLKVDQEVLSFGRVRLAASRDLELTVTNPSTKGIEVEGVIDQGSRAAFTLRTGAFSLPGGGSRPLTVRYEAGTRPALDAARLVFRTEGLAEVTVNLEGEAVDTVVTESCGDGVVGATERCDPPTSCPTCDDGNACTRDVVSGSAATCDVVCGRQAITSCVSSDGCCPSGCSGLTDTDCTGCGNSVCDAPQETCENCVTDCGAGYSVNSPNTTCSGATRLATFGKWCSTELIIVDTLTPLSTAIDVQVHRNRPFVLALVARDAAQWVVRLMPGHQLQRIVASGPSTQGVTFQGGSVPVTHYDTPSTWFGCGDVGDPACDAAEQRRRAIAASNTPVTMYLGCAGMSTASIN